MSSPVDFLLLEDNRLVARSLIRILSTFGIVLHVETCEEAKNFLMDGDVPALVTDVDLPDGSGIDVAEWAVAKGRARRVLVLSGMVDRDRLNRAGALEATYLLKPVDPKQVQHFAVTVRDNRVEDLVAARVGVWQLRYELSEAEADILRMAALGAPRADIVRAREVELETVKKQTKKLLARTGDERLSDAVTRLHLEIEEHSLAR